MSKTHRNIPLNFFGIPFGLLGLADCWLVAAGHGLAPVAIGRVLAAIATLVWAVVLVAHLRGMASRSVGAFLGELADPVAGPFSALAVISPMLTAADALYPLSHSAGSVVVDVTIVATLMISGWLTGTWIYGSLELPKVHPGYFLPGVAGGFVASACAAIVGQIGVAQVLFGLGMFSWIVVGSIVLGRLFLGPPLPNPLIPTLAIEVAPAAVATFAWFSLDGGRVDTVVRLLAGYGLMMIASQLRLIPAYRALKFMPSFWAFTFSWSAVAFAGLSWLGITQPSGWHLESYVTLALISALVGAIAARTAVALRREELIPAPAVATPAPPQPVPAVA